MKRFSKAQLIADLYARADAKMSAHNIDHKNGTSQLWPKGADEATKKAIDRAVAYGAMLALLDAAGDVEGGCLGVAPAEGGRK